MKNEDWKLGRYVRVREREDGTHSVVMEVTRHMRPEGWPASIALPMTGSRYGALHDPRFARRVERDARSLYARLQRRREEDANRPVFDRKTVVELAEIYYRTLRFRRLSKSRQDRARLNIKKIIAWSAALGHPDFCTIRKPDIEDFLAPYDDRPFMQLDLRSLLNVLAKEAIGAGWRSDNCTQGIPWTAPPPNRKAVLWTNDDVARFATYAVRMKQPGLGAMIAFFMHTGQRVSDLRKATWDSVRGSHLTIHQSKTKKSVRILLPKRLVSMLHAVRIEGSNYLFNDYDTRTGFTGPHLTARFNEVRIAASEPGGPHFTLRTLRHSAVCEMIKAGASLFEIAGVTGHKAADLVKIIERYAIDLEGFGAAAVRKVNEMNGGSEDDFEETPLPMMGDMVGQEPPKRYQPPPFDEARPGQHLPAMLGQHRMDWTFPAELMGDLAEDEAA